MTERPTIRDRPAIGRTPLTRERVVTAALALADASGIEALSMRRLARSVGVEAMSLYHHVEGKDDLLDAMIDAVFAEIEIPDDDRPWADWMNGRASSLRDALLRHRWAIGLMDSRTSPGPATMRHHDAVLGACRRAGFSVEMSAHAFALVDSYVYGFVLQEVSLPAGDDAATMATPDPGAYPYLGELSAEHIAQVGYSFADEFAFGLALVLDAMWSAARPTSPNA